MNAESRLPSLYAVATSFKTRRPSTSKAAAATKAEPEIKAKAAVKSKAVTNRPKVSAGTRAYRSANDAPRNQGEAQRSQAAVCGLSPHDHLM